MDLTFSQRIGKTEVRNIFQTDSIDDVLRNALWNYIDNNVLHEWKKGKSSNYKTTNDSVISVISTDFFHKRYEGITVNNAEKYIDAYYNHCMKSDWYRVYDFLEFSIKQLSNYSFRNELSAQSNAMANINLVLEKHMSGYRYVNGVLSPIIDNNEIDSVQEANNNANSNVKLHLQTSLGLLSDRTSPDYRNSIKEAISAVEAVLRELTQKNTLGDALKSLEQSAGLKINTQFQNGLEKIYAYTNNKDTGIRHALLADEINEIKFEDAKFMLVLCSAFINYIMAKKQDK